MLWIQIGRGTAMLVEDSDTWSDIIGTGEKGSGLGAAEDWNTGRGGKEREILNNQTI